MSRWFSASSPAAGLTLTVLLLGAATVRALPVVAGHPRVYLDDAKVAEIQGTMDLAPPLSGTSFPQHAGTIEFDIRPRSLPDGETQMFEQVFDAYSTARNHLFVRHDDEKSTSTELAFQVVLQSVDGYVASGTVTMVPDQWVTFRLSWNADTHTATAQAGDGEPVSLPWQTDGGDEPLEFVPDGQQVAFHGRDDIDDLRFYDGEDLSTAELVARFLLDEGSGRVTGAAGHEAELVLSPDVEWISRGESDVAVSMGGGTLQDNPRGPLIMTRAWERVKNRADSYATDLSAGEPVVDVALAHPGGIIDVARNLGLANLVEPDPQYEAAALIYADRLLALQSIDLGGDFTQGGRVEAMGLLYDWFFPLMTSTTNPASGGTYAADLAQSIQDHIRALEGYLCGNGQVLQGDWHCDTSTPHPDFVGGHSHSNNTRILAALLAIIDEHPELMPLLDTVHDLFADGYNPVREWVCENGGHHMGYAYGGTYTLLDSILAFRVGANVDMASPWQNDLIYRYIYALRGDMQYPPSGDGFTFGANSSLLAQFGLWAAAHPGGGHATAFFEQWVQPLRSGGSSEELIYWAPMQDREPIEELPLAEHFRNSGQVLMRDRWDYSAAATLELKSTSFWSANHHHLDQNSITLFFRGPLLIDSGLYDSYGTEHWHNYYTRTIAHNSLVVWDPAEVFERSASVFCCSNDGGQQFLKPQNPTLEQMLPGGSNHLDGVTAFENTSSYAYALGNASKAYGQDKLDAERGFLRQVLFLRTPSFWSWPVSVVFDEVTVQPDRASLRKRLLWHMIDEPEPLAGESLGPGVFDVSGSQFTVRNQGGLLFIDTVLPSDPLVRKVGGADAGGDYRFLVPTDDEAGYESFPPDTALKPEHPEVGGWRLEISASQPTQKEFFLHVLSLAEEAAEVERPTVVDLSTEATAVVWIAEQQIVAFNKNEAPASSVEWRMPVPFDRAVIVGVEPNERYIARVESADDGLGGYRVSVLRDSTGPFLSSAHGIVDTSFEALPGGAPGGDEDTGCGCVTAGARTAQGLAAGLCLLPLLFWRRRSRRGI